MSFLHNLKGVFSRALENQSDSKRCNSYRFILRQRIRLAVGLASAIVFGSPSIGLAQPFICDTSLYIVIGSSNGTPFSQLNSINRSVDPFSFEPIGDQVNNYNYNALAYNPVDNYLYAIVEAANASSPFPVGDILRIGQDGVPVSLGQPQGAAISYDPNAGAFLTDGTYVVGRQANPIYTIDVTTPPPTATLKGAVPGARFADVAVNPYDPTSNRVYTIDDNSDQLVYFDVTNPSAGSTVAISGGNTTINHNHGSQFYDVFGNLLYRSASTNALYRVNSDGTDTFLANSASGGAHDGASCFAVGLTKEIDAIAPVPAGQTVTYTYKIGNASSLAMTVTLTDDLRSVANYPASAVNESAAPVDGGYTGIVNTPSGTVALSNGDQTLTISDISLAPQSITTLTAEVTIPPSATPDTYYNQASLTGLPPGFVSIVQSDYPETALFEDPTPVQVIDPVASDPNVLLVKRITLLNGAFSSINGDNLAAYIDDPASPYDDNTITITTSPINPGDPAKDTDKWPTPNSFLIGAINGGNVLPNDELEYTIYFLSTGGATAKNVRLCDLIPDFVDFMPNVFNVNPPADPNGDPTGDSGIVLGLGTGASEIAQSSLTNEIDGDGGYYCPPGEDPTATFPNLNCGGANTNGAVVVNLGDLPNAASSGAPNGSYGFIRFRARVR